MRGRTRGVAFHDQAGTGRRLRQLARIFRAIEEGEIARRCAIEGGRSGDAAVGIGAGAQSGAGERRDLAHGKPAPAAEEEGLGHAVRPGACGNQNFVPPPKRNCCTRS